jgi:hypothetical protein
MSHVVCIILKRIILKAIEVRCWRIIAQTNKHKVHVDYASQINTSLGTSSDGVEA